MDLTSPLAPVLEAARTYAQQVDATGEFPQAAVDALRGSGLLGLTLPTEAGGLGGGPAGAGGGAEPTGRRVRLHRDGVPDARQRRRWPSPPRPRRPSRPGVTTGQRARSWARSRSPRPGPGRTSGRRCRRARPSTGGTQTRPDKSWVTSAGHADVYVVSTLTSPDCRRTTHRPVRGARRHGRASRWPAPLRGLGLRGNASAPMTFDLTDPAERPAGRARRPGSG